MQINQESIFVSLAVDILYNVAPSPTKESVFLFFISCQCFDKFGYECNPSFHAIIQ